MSTMSLWVGSPPELNCPSCLVFSIFNQLTTHIFLNWGAKTSSKTTLCVGTSRGGQTRCARRRKSMEVYSKPSLVCLNLSSLLVLFFSLFHLLQNFVSPLMASSPKDKSPDRTYHRLLSVFLFFFFNFIFPLNPFFNLSLYPSLLSCTFYFCFFLCGTFIYYVSTYHVLCFLSSFMHMLNMLYSFLSYYLHALFHRHMFYFYFSFPS